MPNPPKTVADKNSGVALLRLYNGFDQPMKIGPPQADLN